MAESIKFLLWFTFSVLFMTFAEHYIHKYHMHRRGWLNRLSPWLFQNHQIIHHPAYRNNFEASDPKEYEGIGVEISVLEKFKYIGVPLIVMGYFIPLFSLAFSLVVIIHNYIWNEVHREMHMPRGRYFHKWKIYHIWRQHHLIHHIYPKNNFNIVCIWGDYILGTYKK